MNLILYRSTERDVDGRIHLNDRRAQQLLTVKRVSVGWRHRVAEIDGAMHWATVTAVTENSVELTVECGEPIAQPQSSGVSLVLALPRPQSLKKILQAVAEMGVEEIFLCGAEHVEKSFFQSKLFADDEFEHYLQLGMEQAISPRLPRVERIPKFWDLFSRVDECCPSDRCLRLLAEPQAVESLERRISLVPQDRRQQTVIAVGPEGGWSEKERAAFAARKFFEVHSGDRVLRVDTAVQVLIAQILVLQRMNLGAETSQQPENATLPD